MLGNHPNIGQPQPRGSAVRAGDASQAAICSGANFSIYVVRELIGVGSTASVYRAHDTRLRREVALKILNTGVLAGAEGLARFVHEARMAAAVRHPNVVSIFDVGVHDGTPFIVMELLSGGDLDGRLNTARALPERALVDIAAQLASGLAAVHDAGVVHRDLRPSNVFLSRGPDGSTQPKLLDFGVSKQTRDNLRVTTHGRRRWAAMPLYTAPEVLLDGEATFSSDQYSLGVLLYECATGVNPFRADTLRESVELITAGQGRSILAQPIRPSRRLAAIIEKAMHVHPDERFADLHELGRALAGLSGRRAWWPRGSSAVVQARRPGSTSLPARRSGPGLRWAFGATVIGCSVAAPLLAWWSGERTRASAPITVTSALAPAEGHAPLAALPAANRYAAPRSVPSGVHAFQPAGAPEPPASTLPASAARTAVTPATPSAPEGAEHPPATPFTEVVEVVEATEPAPGAAPLGGLPGAAAPATGPLQSSVTPQENGALLSPSAPIAVSSRNAIAPRSDPERGTNGALIFD